MDLSLESNKIEEIVGDSCIVGYVARIISRRIFHCMRVVDHRSIVLRRHKQLVMLDKEFLGHM